MVHRKFAAGVQVRPIFLLSSQNGLLPVGLLDGWCMFSKVYKGMQNTQTHESGSMESYKRFAIYADPFLK